MPDLAHDHEPGHEATQDERPLRRRKRCQCEQPAEWLENGQAHEREAQHDREDGRAAVRARRARTSAAGKSEAGSLDQVLRHVLPMTSAARAVTPYSARPTIVPHTLTMTSSMSAAR